MLKWRCFFSHIFDLYDQSLLTLRLEPNRKVLLLRPILRPSNFLSDSRLTYSLGRYDSKDELFSLVASLSTVLDRGRVNWHFSKSVKFSVVIEVLLIFIGFLGELNLVETGSGWSFKTSFTSLSPSSCITLFPGNSKKSKSSYPASLIGVVVKHAGLNALAVLLLSEIGPSCCRTTFSVSWYVIHPQMSSAGNYFSGNFPSTDLKFGTRKVAIYLMRL